MRGSGKGKENGVTRGRWSVEAAAVRGGAGRAEGGGGDKYPQKASFPEANAVSCFSISVPGTYLRRGPFSMENIMRAHEQENNTTQRPW